MIGFDAIGSISIGELSGEADTVIFAPAAFNVAVTAPAPRLNTVIYAPASPVVTVAAATAPGIRAGKSIRPPVAAVTVTGAAPRISISATQHPPTVVVFVDAPTAQIAAGNYVEASNTVTMNTTFGEIGSSSLGEFAIGEGEPASRIVKQPPIVLVISNPPRVVAGKSVRPSASNITVTAPRAEIDSRRRKLRVWAIAS